MTDYKNIGEPEIIFRASFYLNSSLNDKEDDDKESLFDKRVWKLWEAKKYKKIRLTNDGLGACWHGYLIAECTNLKLLHDFRKTVLQIAKRLKINFDEESM